MIIENKRIMLLLSWTSTFIYMGIIFYLSSISMPLQHELPHGMDKVIHFAEYAVLGLLMSYSLRSAGIRRYVIAGWMFSMLYGVGDEIHQAFVPMRESSAYDMLADSIGSFAGSALLRNLRI
jgi:VanZ family protein